MGVKVTLYAIWIVVYSLYLNFRKVPDYLVFLLLNSFFSFLLFTTLFTHSHKKITNCIENNLTHASCENYVTNNS